MERQTLLARLVGICRRFLFWLPSAQKTEEEHPESSHDHSLVLSVVSPTSIPGWRQLRNITRLFTKIERRIFHGALVLALASLGIASALFLRSRLVPLPVVDGTLTEAVVGEPRHLNPLDAPGNDIDADLVRLIYSGLFRFDELMPVPDLVESYEWSADRKILTAHLRKDARFHDGEALTAEDVRFTFDNIQDPARKTSLAPLFRGIHIAVSDATTLVFTLERPDPSFLQKLTVGILPAHLWQNIPAATARLSDLNLKPIGSGSYRVKSFLRDSQGKLRSYTLERFDRGAGTRPFLKSIVFSFFPNRKEAEDALKTGLVDTVAFVPSSERTRLGTVGFQAVRLTLPQETVAFFNLKNSALAVKEVRQALALAVNRQEVVEAQQRASEAVWGPYPFDAATGTPPDLERARTLLTAAGWVLPLNGSIRIWKPIAKKTTVSAKPKRKKSKKAEPPAPIALPATTSTELTLTITVPEEPELLAVADTLKRAWSLLGAKVLVEALPTKELVRRATRDRTTQIVLLNVLLGPDQDISSFWWSAQAVDRGLNFSNLRDRAIDDALDRVQSATATEMLPALRAAASAAILNATPAVFLTRPSLHYLVSDKIHGVPNALICATPAERFQTIHRWYRKTGWRWR